MRRAFRRFGYAFLFAGAGIAACAPELGDSPATGKTETTTEVMVKDQDGAGGSKPQVVARDSPKLAADLAQALQSAQPDELLAIIVEVVTHRPTVQFDRAPGATGTGRRPTGIAEGSAATAEDGFAAARAYFNERAWSGHAPVFLQAASAVSVSATVAQIGALLQQPFVREISLNQRHKPVLD